jgi:acetylglutamate kinase
MIQVVKIGGNIVDNPEALDAFCQAFARMEGPKILVHGGGVMASHIQESLGLKPIMVEGRRVTDRKTLSVVTMVYAGYCNKTIVALLQKYGCNALGLAGCDGGVIRARRRGPKTLSDGFTKMDFGFVGDVSPTSFNIPFIRDMLAGGIVPVFCPINHDGQGQLFNTNADTIAGSLAAALCAGLVYCFEKKGVLYDKEDDNSVIPVLDKQTYERYRLEGRIDKGMVPKLDNAFGAMQKGASRVVIKHALDLLDDTGTILEA